METGALKYVREDDYVEFFLFPPLKIRSESLEENITKLYQDVQEIIDTISNGYIWHKDVLKIYKRFQKRDVLSEELHRDLPPHIYGVCHYGDNIEDEWFIVYIVREITKKLNTLVARVVDSDGEFLLIEAANILPSWASPENCSNRVFIYNGKLHLLVPENYNEINELTLEEALLQLYSDRNTLAPPEIQVEVFQRFTEHPYNIAQTLHTATVYTPVGVAALLKEEPSLIAAAVHAFCNRDPIDMKVCRAMKYFPPENRVNTSVKFTKCLYAMLMHNNFNPDRRTGWNLPLPNSAQYKAHNIGVKLACGFEILVSQAQPDRGLETNKAWKDYFQGLKNRNYFQEFLEGSNAYNELFDKAQKYFIDNVEQLNVAPVLGSKVLKMLSVLDVDEMKFRNNESMLPLDDDDKWLTIEPKELEMMLQKRYGKKTFFSMNGHTGQTEFTGKISDFLEHMSSVDGAEFPQQSAETSNMPQRPKRGIKLKKKAKGVSFSDTVKSRSPSPSKKFSIDFEADQFSSAVQNILDLVIPEDDWDLDSGSDFSEYGSENEMENDIFDIDSAKPLKKKSTMKSYMDAMDSEISQTVLGKSFEKMNSSTDCEVVDVDANTVKNMMESYRGEVGGVGPAGNLLGPLGFTNYENIITIDEEVD